MGTNTPCDVNIVANLLHQFNVNEDMSSVDQSSKIVNKNNPQKPDFLSESTVSSVSGQGNPLSSSGSALKNDGIASRSAVTASRSLKDIAKIDTPDLNTTLEFAERTERASDELISSLKVAKSIADPAVNGDKMRALLEKFEKDPGITFKVGNKTVGYGEALNELDSNDRTNVVGNTAVTGGKKPAVYIHFDEENLDVSILDCNNKAELYMSKPGSMSRENANENMEKVIGKLQAKANNAAIFERSNGRRYLDLSGPDLGLGIEHKYSLPIDLSRSF